MTSRNDIIESALTIIGAQAAGESASSEDISLSAKALNSIVDSWSGTGAHLWVRNSATLFLQPAQIKYILGSTIDNATEVFTETTLSTASAQGDTTPTLTSSTGLKVGDNLGIKLDDGTVFWTIVECNDPVTICDGLPSAAASGNTVYFYTTDLTKPLRIPDSRRVQGTGTTLSEIEMVQLGRIDYLNLPNKNASGTPVQFYYDPKRAVGELFIWPAPTINDTILNFTYYKSINDFDVAEDIADFPNEWIRALDHQLAIDMSPRLMGREAGPKTQLRAQKYLDDALDWDSGDAPVFFQYSEGVGR